MTAADEILVPGWDPKDVVIAAEQALIGSLIQSRTAAESVSETVQAGDFIKTRHRLVFEAVVALIDRGDDVDPVSVLGELTRQGTVDQVGAGPALMDLMHHAGTTAWEKAAEIVRDDSIRRGIAEVGPLIGQLTARGDFDLDRDVDMIRQRLDRATSRMTGDDLTLIGEVVLRRLDSLESKTPVEYVEAPYTDLEMMLAGLRPGQVVIIGARPSIGKALALDTPIPTPSGWTTMGEIQVGDEVLGADGKPTTVTFATEVMTGRACYEVEFSDGATLIADADHQWFTTTRASRKSAYTRSLPRKGGPLARDMSSRFIDPGVRTTKEIAATLRCIDGRLNHGVPVAEPAQLPEQELLLPPYVLGAWLGDGTSAGSGFTCADPEILANIAEQGIEVRHKSGIGYSLILPIFDPRQETECLVCGIRFVPQQAGVRTCGKSCGGKLRAIAGPVPLPGCPRCGGKYSGKKLCQACREEVGTVTGCLRTLGVLGDKHIPAEYLRASEGQRRDLLAGLLDTDGHITKNGCVQLGLTNRRLAFDAWELILSLGYRATMTAKHVRGRTPASSTCYIVSFTPTDAVFKLPRKAERQKTSGVARTKSRMITAVREVPTVPVRCIQVDNEDHLYLAGRNWIPTHNSTVAMDFARNAAVRLKRRTLFFSLEMTHDELADRILSAEGKVELGRIRDGKLTDEDWDRIAHASPRILEAPLVVDDSPHCTLGRIRARLRGMSRTDPARLVIVDYLGLMDPPKADSRERQVAELSRGLKLLAKEFHVPIIALSQLNRESTKRSDRRPAMSELRDSGAVEQDADIVILLHREDAFEKESPRAGEMDLIVEKNRNGATGTVVVAWQGHYSRAMNMAQEWTPHGVVS